LFDGQYFVIWRLVTTIITFLVIWSIFDYYLNFDNREEYIRKRILCYSSITKFLIIIFTYLSVLFLYLVYRDMLEDNHFIINFVLFLIPSFFFYRIYNDGVKNKLFSRFESFMYVTTVVSWTILGPFSIMWWWYITMSSTPIGS